MASPSTTAHAMVDPQTISRMVALYREGWSMSRLRTFLRIDLKTIRKYLVLNGVQPRTKGEAERLKNRQQVDAKVDWPECMARYQAGDALESLARRYHTSWNKVRDGLVEHGVRLRGRSCSARAVKASIMQAYRWPWHPDDPGRYLLAAVVAQSVSDWLRVSNGWTFKRVDVPSDFATMREELLDWFASREFAGVCLSLLGEPEPQTLWQRYRIPVGCDCAESVV